jgi:hypothetical protein
VADLYVAGEGDGDIGGFGWDRSFVCGSTDLVIFDFDFEHPSVQWADLSGVEQSEASLGH